MFSYDLVQTEWSVGWSVFLQFGGGDGAHVGSSQSSEAQSEILVPLAGLVSQSAAPHEFVGNSYFGEFYSSCASLSGQFSNLVFCPDN